MNGWGPRGARSWEAVRGARRSGAGGEEGESWWLPVDREVEVGGEPPVPHKRARGSSRGRVDGRATILPPGLLASWPSPPLLLATPHHWVAHEPLHSSLTSSLPSIPPPLSYHRYHFSHCTPPLPFPLKPRLLKRFQHLITILRKAARWRLIVWYVFLCFLLQMKV